MFVIKAQAALAKCESELRSLLGQAANAGDYDAVLKLTSWAKAVAALVGASSPPASLLDKVTTKKRALATKYPRFGRRGDSLVKVGWSKREKAEYEHKAPLRAVAVVADVVKKKGADGRIFQINALLPCFGPDGETIVADYQVYLIVAWWKTVGLLEQHGRQGYSIPKPSNFASDVEHACNDLIET